MATHSFEDFPGTICGIRQNCAQRMPSPNPRTSLPAAAEKAR
jgi:hypothetical protein